MVSSQLDEFLTEIHWEVITLQRFSCIKKFLAPPEEVLAIPRKEKIACANMINNWESTWQFKLLNKQKIKLFSIVKFSPSLYRYVDDWSCLLLCVATHQSPKTLHSLIEERKTDVLFQTGPQWHWPHLFFHPIYSAPSGTEGSDVSAATPPVCGGAVQTGPADAGHPATGAPQPVSHPVSHSRRDRGVWLWGASAEGVTAGEQATQLHEQTR